jgi:Tfp pilus assembly protein PilO
MSVSDRGLSHTTITAIGAVVAVLYGLFVFLPTVRTINQLRAKRMVDERAIIESELLVRELRSSEDQLAFAKEHAESWRRDSRTLQGPKLFDAVTRCATDGGLELAEMTPGTKRSLQSLRQTPLKLKGHGSMAAMQSFLHDIEQLPTKAWCTDLVLAPSRDQPDHPDRLEYRLELLVFESGANFSDQANPDGNR